MSRLKAVWYNGTAPQYNGRVAYLVLGQDVYFTAIATEGRAIVTSTINSAEGIILAIAKTENVDWRRLNYHDIQTPLGYPNHPKTWWVIDQLVVQINNGRPHVDGWKKVAQGPVPSFAHHCSQEFVEENKDELKQAADEENRKLRGVPPKVLEMFAPYLA